MPWVRDNAGLILVDTLHYEIRQIRQLIEEQELGHERVICILALIERSTRSLQLLSVT